MLRPTSSRRPLVALRLATRCESCHTRLTPRLRSAGSTPTLCVSSSASNQASHEGAEKLREARKYTVHVEPYPPWLYLDADGFFASCEEAADPRLHGRAVGVVAGEVYPGAPLIAVNTCAKRAGVRSGHRVCDARARCPRFVVRPQRVERYVECHARMVEAVGRVLPVSAVHS